MRNFKVMMSYNGFAYHGFQRQENAIAIQQIIEETLEKITGEKIIIYGCSRTDTGVHANEYCFNFLHSNSITCNGVVRSLNSLLPDDIGIKSCEEVSCDFHARYHCKGKEYIYLIHNSNLKNPFLKDRAYRYGVTINEKLLNDASKAFVGTHDFKSFCSSGSSSTNTVRTIEKCEVTRDGEIVKILVKGNGFLYNMVRIMIGTLLFVNEGKISSSQIEDILNAKERRKAGRTAPAHGLYLNKIYY